MEPKTGDEGYARYKLEGSKFCDAVTAWVTVTKVNGEYLEFKHADLDKTFRAKKDKFKFITNEED